MHSEAVSGHLYIHLGLGIYGGGACLHSLQGQRLVFSKDAKARFYNSVAKGQVSQDYPSFVTLNRVNANGRAARRVGLAGDRVRILGSALKS